VSGEPPIILPHFSTREEAEAAGVREWRDDEGMRCYIDDDGGGWDLYTGSGADAQAILDALKQEGIE